MNEKLSKSTIMILFMTLFFSLSVSFSFWSQDTLGKISVIHQEQIFDYMVFIDQQSNMLIWDEVCKGDGCQSMLERAMILDDLSTNLSTRFNERWIEIQNLEGCIKTTNFLSVICFIIGLVFFFFAIKVFC